MQGEKKKFTPNIRKKKKQHKGEIGIQLIKEWLFQVFRVFVPINKNQVPGATCEMHRLAGNDRNASEMTLW